MTTGPTQRPAAAYVLTHYPRLAQTFLADEIRVLPSLGCDIDTSPINTPAANEVSDDHSRAERDRTLYLKSTRPGALVGAVLRAMRRAPVGMARLACAAALQGGADLRRVTWRLLQ